MDKSSYLLNINLHSHHSHKNKIFFSTLFEMVSISPQQWEKMIYSHGIKDKCGKRRIYEIPSLVSRFPWDVVILLNFYDFVFSFWVYERSSIPHDSRAAAECENHETWTHNKL